MSFPPHKKGDTQMERLRRVAPRTPSYGRYRSSNNLSIRKPYLLFRGLRSRISLAEAHATSKAMSTSHQAQSLTKGRLTKSVLSIVSLMMDKTRRSYWIPGSYAPTLSEECHSFLRPLTKKGFKEERVITIGLYAIGKSTTLESNKSHL